MDVDVTWKGKMSFFGTAESGFVVNLGTDSALGGDNDGFRPLELMAISLAGCTAMDVISILNKKRQEVHDFQVKVHIDRVNEHPKVFSSAKIEYILGGHAIDENAVRRAIELSALRYCPAQAMMAKIIPITLKYEIFEGNSQEGQSIAAQTLTLPSKGESE